MHNRSPIIRQLISEIITKMLQNKTTLNIRDITNKLIQFDEKEERSEHPGSNIDGHIADYTVPNTRAKEAKNIPHNNKFPVKKNVCENCHNEYQ